MLIQTTSPRISLMPLEYPAYVCVHTLRKVGVSTGEVLFGAYATGGRLPPGATIEDAMDPNSRAMTVYKRTTIQNNAQVLEPRNVYPIEGEEGFQALEYMLPFWELFREEDRNHNLGLVPFCTGGFSLTVRSAFRADPRTYAEHTATFQIHMPISGGGVIRLGDSMTDIANSTFDQWAPDPHPHKDLELQDSYNRTHRLGNRAAIDKRREERIRAAEASIAAEKQRNLLPK